VDPLAAAPPRIARAALRAVWEREGWPVDAMTFERWERLAALAVGQGAAVDLPGRFRARRCGGVLQIGPIDAFRPDGSAHKE
jgi:hypothetical protein